jgi:hypothetical protein
VNALVDAASVLFGEPIIPATTKRASPGCGGSWSAGRLQAHGPMLIH